MPEDDPVVVTKHHADKQHKLEYTTNSLLQSRYEAVQYVCASHIYINAPKNSTRAIMPIACPYGMLVLSIS